MIYLITLWILFSPSQLKEINHFHDSFIIWNVGQGQWTTLNTLETCYHFDLGGEFFPLKKIHSTCKNKKNELFISHWDLDHMSALKFLTKWSRVCRREDPLGTASLSKTKLLESFKHCNDLLPKNSVIKKIFPLPKDEITLPNISNAQSKVFLVNDWLIPGDSRIEDEFIWSLRLNETLTGKNIKGLIIGHHGSKTSSSSQLIQKLSNLQWSISSARWRRYKHPHPSVIQKFRKYKKRILRTEDWGSFIFQI